VWCYENAGKYIPTNLLKKTWMQSAEEKRGRRIGGKSQKMAIRKKIQVQRGKRPRNE